MLYRYIWILKRLKLVNFVIQLVYEIFVDSKYYNFLKHLLNTLMFLISVRISFMLDFKLNNFVTLVTPCNLSSTDIVQIYFHLWMIDNGGESLVEWYVDTIKTYNTYNNTIYTKFIITKNIEFFKCNQMLKKFLNCPTWPNDQTQEFVLGFLLG